MQQEGGGRDETIVIYTGTTRILLPITLKVVQVPQISAEILAKLEWRLLGDLVRTD